MRHRNDTELAAVAEEIAEGGLTWCLRDVKRLIRPYKPQKELDAVLKNLGEDYYFDEIHDLQEDEEENDDPDPECDDEDFAWLDKDLDEHTAVADATEAVALVSSTQLAAFVDDSHTLSL